jgi:hypothetical protein
MSAFPQQYYLDDNSKTINFCVPKFHLPAHILSCQTAYSFNFIKGVGRTDSKAPEHGCVNINPVTTSTCKIGPGSRHLYPQQPFQWLELKKMCLMDMSCSCNCCSSNPFNLGKTIAHKLKAALPECLEYTNDLYKFEAALDPTQLASWKHDIEAWESDHSKPNPFELKVTSEFVSTCMIITILIKYFKLSPISSISIVRGQKWQNETWHNYVSPWQHTYSTSYQVDRTPSKFLILIQKFPTLIWKSFGCSTRVVCLQSPPDFIRTLLDFIQN